MFESTAEFDFFLPGGYRQQQHYHCTYPNVILFKVQCQEAHNIHPFRIWFLIPGEFSMKKALVSIIMLMALLIIIGGATPLFQSIDIFRTILLGFMPVFEPGIKQSFKEYLSSAYFIVSIIIFLGSTFGVVISIKERKKLYSCISLLLEIISFISIICNLVICN